MREHALRLRACASRGVDRWSRGGEAAAPCRVLRRNKRGAAAPARIYSRVFLAANDEDMIGPFPCGCREPETERGRGLYEPANFFNSTVAFFFLII
jgi:hypothetical protein